MSYRHLVLTALLLALLTVPLIRWGARRRMVSILTLCLFLWSWMPVGWLSSGTLEWWYPVRRFPAGEAEAMVVLAGGIYRRNASQPEDLSGSETYLRCSHASWLYRNWRALPIVVSGGPSSDKPGEAVYADVMARLLATQGVPESMIWLERSSRSTYENALYSAALLRARGIGRIVLVTEAQHMLRSDLSFRRQGLTVVPAPCSYRYLSFRFHWLEFFPSGRNIGYNEDNAHEWAGLVWYKLKGRI